MGNTERNDIYAGEIGAGHTMTALYEIVPVGVAVPGGKVDAPVLPQNGNRRFVAETKRGDFARPPLPKDQNPTSNSQPKPWSVRILSVSCPCLVRILSVVCPWIARCKSVSRPYFVRVEK